MASTENRTARSLALDLHTDITNLDTYAANPAMVAPLLATAEEKLAILAEYLATVRREAGLRPSLVISGRAA